MIEVVKTGGVLFKEEIRIEDSTVVIGSKYIIQERREYGGTKEDRTRKNRSLYLFFLPAAKPRS